MKRIIRVFPTRTSMSPLDEMAFFGEPGLFIPDHDEVHISTVYTWDIERAENLRKSWQGVTDKPVLLGGPAFGSKVNGFIPGKYITSGVTFTSRGCPNKCSFCLVPRNEGGIREITIHPGNIIQDNNFLACSRPHQEKVFQMLKGQRVISFRGGLEANRVNSWFAEQLRGLRIFDLWLACDTKERLRPLKRAVELLTRAGFSRNKLRCYVLIGDDMAENEARLREVYEIGCLPFAQLYQPVEGKQYSQAWKQFARRWSRPAICKAIMRIRDREG